MKEYVFKCGYIQDRDKFIKLVEDSVGEVINTYEEINPKKVIGNDYVVMYRARREIPMEILC